MVSNPRETESGHHVDLLAPCPHHLQLSGLLGAARRLRFRLGFAAATGPAGRRSFMGVAQMPSSASCILDTRYLFYATTFKLWYDKDGGLRATARRTCSYTVPRESGDFNWWAFGI
jgi:hypothetical protein